MNEWTWQKWAVFAAPGALVVLALLLGLMLRNTLRSRFSMGRQLAGDPDLAEHLVVFNWSRKVLYLPTILASLIAAGIMALWPEGPHVRLVAALWLAVFFLNFIVDEYEINLKALLIGILALMVLFLWLSYFDWVMPFLHIFDRFDANINATVYLIMALTFGLAIAISWVRGLFYYAAITPNYLNIQSGPTETGELINREEFGTRLDTADFLERLLGFGRIIITFADRHRPPLVLLVGRIGQRAAQLESIRGKLVVDHYPAAGGVQ